MNQATPKPTAAEREGEPLTAEEALFARILDLRHWTSNSAGADKRHDCKCEDCKAIKQIVHLARQAVATSQSKRAKQLAEMESQLLAARRENEELKARLELREKDRQRWDWYEGNATAHGVHLSCWNVGGDRNNGWTVGLDDEDNLGRGVDARMAIDDAMRHPERLRAALAATQEPR